MIFDFALFGAIAIGIWVLVLIMRWLFKILVISIATVNQAKAETHTPEHPLKMTGDTVAYEALKRCEIYESYIRNSCELGHMSSEEISALFKRLDAIVTAYTAKK